MKLCVRLFMAAAIYISGLCGAHAATTLNVNESGILLGASGVDVNGTLFDVSFIDGSCENLFGGCTVFSFTTQSDTFAAITALETQVFSSALYDGSPQLTNGCTSTIYCFVYIPYEQASPSTVSTRYFRNCNPVNCSDNWGPATLNSTNTTLSSSSAVWAVWTAATPAVPVPAAAWLFGSGLVGLSGVARKRSARA